jgi:hypothetical protein
MISRVVSGLMMFRVLRIISNFEWHVYTCNFHRLSHIYTHTSNENLLNCTNTHIYIHTYCMPSYIHNETYREPNTHINTHILHDTMKHTQIYTHIYTHITWHHIYTTKHITPIRINTNTYIHIHIFILPRQQGIHKLVNNININITGKYGHKGALIKRGCIATIDIYIQPNI